MSNTPMQDQVMEEIKMKESSEKNHLWALGFFLVLLFVGSFYLWKSSPNTFFPFTKTTPEELSTFSSAEDFLSYMESGSSGLQGGFFGLERSIDMAPTAMMLDSVANESKSTLPLAAGAGRVSDTNVQVLGVDEPDIVKTDGKNIFSSLNKPIYRIMTEPTLMMIDIDERSSVGMPPRNAASPLTSIINAFPPEDLETIAKIDKQGDLLLEEDMLMVFGDDDIVSYDVSDPYNPKKSWDIDIEENTQIHSSRKIGNDVYIVTRSYVNYEQPCPLSPLSPVGGLTIPCERIYHPKNPILADVTYSIMKVEIKTGKISNSISFVGSSQSSIVYVSNNSIYITYTSYGDYSQFMYEFFSSLGGELVSSQVKAKLNKLASYEISANAKLIEIQNILQDFYRGISKDERRRIENEIENKMEEFATTKMRDMEKTGIVKISLDNLDIESNGSVPGHPLNQFSLDEYKGNLRIATTVGGSRSLQGSESANDVYVLDEHLNDLGKITDLGIDERIYSARFMGEMGYVVTFRETDPFYVLDLSDPKNPTMQGELKIPGYSSYLHPISKNMILGVGKEDANVKISMFDVSNPKDPLEVDKYSLDEYWSDVSNTHHAFLQDEKHKIFFLPAGQDGYIFSYEDHLSLEKVVSSINAKRALFLDDYLYIVGENEIIVLEEDGWEKVGSIEY